MENYFNYFTEIEEYFWKKRGTALLISTLDWALIDSWKEAQIPLEAVLQGIDRAFEKHTSRRKQARKVNSLAYCHQEIVAAAAEKQRSILHHGSEGEPFPREELATFLERNAAALENASRQFEEQRRPESAATFRSLVASLAELATAAQVRPVIALTDGPLELWGGSSRDNEGQSHFAESLRSYLKALEELHKAGAATAGYVDKPRADLVVRALEVAATPVDNLGDIRKQRPLRGVTDQNLFAPLLGPGERSAVFAIQSQLAPKYAGALALQFFYLNVGSETRPWLARVEIPAWVAEDASLLGALHAVLVAQSGMMGSLAYPYVLHRAHEIAVVTREEREQVTQMLLAELQSAGVDIGQISFKQAAKDLPGRTRR